MADSPELKFLRAATPEEIAAEADKSRAMLLEIARGVFLRRRPYDQKDLLELIAEALVPLQTTFAKTAQGAPYKPGDVIMMNVCFLTIAAVLDTMKSSPLYGTRALADQLEHHVERLANTGRPNGGVIFHRE